MSTEQQGIRHGVKKGQLAVAGSRSPETMEEKFCEVMRPKAKWQ